MAGELIVFGAGILRTWRERLARHVACLAGGDLIFAVEGKWGLLGEAGTLPLIVDSEGPQPFVVVECPRDGGLVTGSAKFGRLVDRAHNSFGVAIQMSEDVGVGDGACDGRPVWVDEDRGRAHDVAAGSSGVSGDDGVAGRAGDALVLKGALFGHALREVSGEKGDGVVAAFAMAGELYTLLVDEHVDVLEIPGLAEAV